MNDLTGRKCEPCRVGAPLITQKEIEELMPRIPNWEIIKSDDIDRLTRMFEFDNFNKALSFTNKIGVIAEEENHHPSILTEWGKVTVTWSTHKTQQQDTALPRPQAGNFRAPNQKHAILSSKIRARIAQRPPFFFRPH